MFSLALLYIKKPTYNFTWSFHFKFKRNFVLQVGLIALLVSQIYELLSRTECHSQESRVPLYILVLILSSFILWVKRESHEKPGKTIIYCFILSNLEDFSFRPLALYIPRGPREVGLNVGSSVESCIKKKKKKETFIPSFWVSRVGRGLTCIFL